jgi:hypothetical protein
MERFFIWRQVLQTGLTSRQCRISGRSGEFAGCPIGPLDYPTNHERNLSRRPFRTKLATSMTVSRMQIGIAVGAGLLLVIIFVGYLFWLNGQGPVLSRSEERDSLSGVPTSIRLNPLRDRESELVAGTFIRSMREGKCTEQLAEWYKDYRKKYADFLCTSEAKHPLISWKVVDWEDAAPLRILRYRGVRYTDPSQSGKYSELFSITLEDKDGKYVVTKYDAMY